MAQSPDRFLCRGSRPHPDSDGACLLSHWALFLSCFLVCPDLCGLSSSVTPYWAMWAGTSTQFTQKLSARPMVSAWGSPSEPLTLPARGHSHSLTAAISTACRYVGGHVPALDCAPRIPRRQAGPCWVHTFHDRATKRETEDPSRTLS